MLESWKGSFTAFHAMIKWVCLFVELAEDLSKDVWSMPWASSGMLRLVCAVKAHLAKHINVYNLTHVFNVFLVYPEIVIAQKTVISLYILNAGQGISYLSNSCFFRKH